MADISQQVQMQQQLNKLLTQNLKLLESINAAYSQQSTITTSVMNTVRTSASSATQAQRNLSSEIKEVDESMEDAKDAAAEFADELENTSTQGGLAAKAMDTLRAGLSGLSGIVGSAIKGVFSLAAGLGKAALSVFAFPFKLFGGLIEEAQAGGGGRPLAEAYEEVREVFGDLASGPGKAVVDTFRKVRKASGGLAGTGLKIRSVFGYGRQGIAALMKDLNELAKAMGDNFYKLQGDFKQMADKAIIFQRGLGLSKEEFGQLAAIAKTRTGDVESYMTNFSKVALTSAKAFGMGVKDMSKGMKELALDVSNFGHLGPEAFAPITAYARKLGLEIKDMAGVMNKFMGFSDTAESAAKLSQQFGINVDAMQLMAAQNPAEKVDMLRKAFFAAGQNLEDFNVQQRRQLENLTDLKGKSLEAAFALENQGINYADIAKKSKDANKQQLTQKQVLGELSKGIKRLIQTMSGPKVKGFFDSFVQGFKRGVKRSGPFRKVMRNIRGGLRSMRRAGIDVGRSFVETFPGIKKMLEGIAEILRPDKFKKFTSVLKKSFKEFFASTGDKKNVGNLLDNIIAGLKKAFGDNKAITGFLEGLKSFAGAAGRTIASIVRAILDKLVTPMVEFISKVLDKATEAAKGQDSWGGKIKAFFGSIMGSISDALKDNPLGEIFMEAFKGIAPLFSGKDESINNFINSLKKGFKSLAGAFDTILVKPLIKAFSDVFTSKEFLLAAAAVGGAIGAGFAASKAVSGLWDRFQNLGQNRGDGGGNIDVDGDGRGDRRRRGRGRRGRPRGRFGRLRNFASKAGGFASRAGGMVNNLLGGPGGAVLAGAMIGNEAGKAINDALDTGFKGGLTDVLTGNFKWDTTREQKRKNAAIANEMRKAGDKAAAASAEAQYKAIREFTDKDYKASLEKRLASSEKYDPLKNPRAFAQTFGSTEFTRRLKKDPAFAQAYEQAKAAGLEGMNAFRKQFNDELILELKKKGGKEFFKQRIKAMEEAEGQAKIRKEQMEIDKKTAELMMIQKKATLLEDLKKAQEKLQKVAKIYDNIDTDDLKTRTETMFGTVRQIMLIIQEAGSKVFTNVGQKAVMDRIEVASSSLKPFATSVQMLGDSLVKLKSGLKSITKNAKYFKKGGKFSTDMSTAATAIGNILPTISATFAPLLPSQSSPPEDLSGTSQNMSVDPTTAKTPKQMATEIETALTEMSSNLENISTSIKNIATSGKTFKSSMQKIPEFTEKEKENLKTRASNYVNAVRTLAQGIVESGGADLPAWTFMAAGTLNGIEPLITKLTKVNEVITSFAKASTKLQDKLGARQVKAAIVALKQLEGVGGDGDIKVYHNLNNRDIRMTVNVKLNTEEVGKAICDVNLGHKGKASHYILGQTGNKDAGFGNPGA
jgi:hypothetical protein